jgi:hypothetical protein
MKKPLLILAVILSFFAFIPISARLADPFFTRPFDRYPNFVLPILLVWPDHIEIRSVHSIAEISPLPNNAGYSFNVPPEREAWVKQQVRDTPSPNPLKAGWIIHIQQLGPERQRIQLELMGDGYHGVVYEARPHEIIPIGKRLAGAGGAFVILGVHLPLWGGAWCIAWLASIQWKKYCRIRQLRQTSSANLR